MGQLQTEITAGKDAKTIQYSYDLSGNRAKMDVTGAQTYNTVYTYDANDRLTKAQTNSPGRDTELTSYYYDRNGNQISQMTDIVDSPAGKAGGISIGGPGDSQTPAFARRQYDGRNRLIGYCAPGVEATYTYQTDGLRAAKTVNGVTTAHVWDGTNIVADLGANNAVNSTYLRRAGLVASRQQNGSYTYYSFNGHGDVTGLTDQNGAVSKTYQHDAFGVQQNQDSADTNPFRFCGEYMDLETKTYYLRARNFEPTTGRFLTEDPARNGLNWYTYAKNNPILFIDPSGLATYILSSTNKTKKQNSDFSKQANALHDKLLKEGEDVHDVIPVNSIADFQKTWKKLKKEATSDDDVYMFFHGNGLSIIFENESSTNAMSINGKSIRGNKLGDLSKLDDIKIRNLYIYTCNSGNIDLFKGTARYDATPHLYGGFFENASYGIKGNVASVLSSKIGKGMVYSIDGELSFGTTVSAAVNHLSLGHIVLNEEPRVGNGNSNQDYYMLSGTRNSAGIVMYFQGQYYGSYPSSYSTGSMAF